MTDLSLDGLYNLVHKDPAGGLRLVEEDMATTGSSDPGRLASLARIKGLAHVQLNAPAAALAALDDAVAVADGAAPEVAGEAHMTRAGILAWMGRDAEAMVAIDRSVSVLDGVARARAVAQRGALAYRRGDLDGALEDLDRAQPSLERDGDQLWLAKLLTNRGIIYGFQGRLGAAEGAMRHAVELYRDLGLDFAAASALQNLAWGAALLGDLPSAFAAYDEAEAVYESLDASTSLLRRDRAEVLLAANLTDEAVLDARYAVEHLTDEGMEADAAEAMLILAEAELVARRPEAAEADALEAEASFRRQGRDRWSVYARLLQLQSRYAAGTLTVRELKDVQGVADRLDRDRHHLAGLRARLLLGRANLRFGRMAGARAALQTAAAARSHRQVRMRTQAWLAETMLRQARGDRSGALRAAAAGLRAVSLARALVGTADVGILVAGHGEELGSIGLGMALEAGRPPTILRWMELTRATALQFAPVRPHDDRELAADLAQFRAAERELLRMQRNGEDTVAVSRRLRDIGTAIRRRRRRIRGSGEMDRKPPTLAEVRRALGPRTLVEIADQDGTYVALVVAEHRQALCRLGSAGAVARELENLRFGLSRLAQRRGSPGARRAATDAVTSSLGVLSALLVDPIGLGDGPVVVVPPADLHIVPWGSIPGLHHRPVTVAPSCRLWLDKIGSGREGTPEVLVVSGPDLPAAAAESRAVASLHPGTNRLSVRQATVDTVIDALGRTGLAHIIAHGDFRADNPLFSALRLVDGPLTVYDLERAGRMPSTVVLSACNAGIPGVRPGNETMGIVAGLLGAGVNTVIASAGLVPDTDATRSVMVAFHRRLAKGMRPAAALAEVQAAAGDGEHGYGAASFVCFGAG